MYSNDILMKSYEISWILVFSFLLLNFVFLILKFKLQLQIIVDDCMIYLDKFIKEGKKFDYVFGDLTDIPLSDTPTGEVWNFFRSILEHAFKILKPTGKYLTHGNGANSPDSLAMFEEQLDKLNPKVKFTRSNAFVPSFMEDWVFYQIAFADVWFSHLHAIQQLIESFWIFHLTLDICTALEINYLNLEEFAPLTRIKHPNNIDVMLNSTKHIKLQFKKTYLRTYEILLALVIYAILPAHFRFVFKFEFQ